MHTSDPEAQLVGSNWIASSLRVNDVTSVCTYRVEPTDNQKPVKGMHTLHLRTSFVGNLEPQMLHNFWSHLHTATLVDHSTGMVASHVLYASEFVEPPPSNTVIMWVTQCQYQWEWKLKNNCQGRQQRGRGGCLWRHRAPAPSVKIKA